jgi:chromosome segregation ATPase
MWGGVNFDTKWLSAEGLTALAAAFTLGAIFVAITAMMIGRSRGAELRNVKALAQQASQRIALLEADLDRARRARAEAERAVSVLQAEHDRLHSQTAQKARRLATLEADLVAQQVEASRATTALERSVFEHKQALESALGEAARLKIELTQMQAKAAEVPSLQDELTRLKARITSIAR